jgi:hypothetical protein
MRKALSFAFAGLLTNAYCYFFIYQPASFQNFSISAFQRFPISAFHKHASALGRSGDFRDIREPAMPVMTDE